MQYSPLTPFDRFCQTFFKVCFLHPLSAMPAVQLIRNFKSHQPSSENPLPELLRTPLGLAIIEIQGTVHAPRGNESGVQDGNNESSQTLDVGRLEFPLYEGSNTEGPWTKRVYLYVGQHQRLTGEIKKLAKPLVVLSRSSPQQNGTTEGPSRLDRQQDQLSIDAVVKHRILFSSRPEPVGK